MPRNQGAPTNLTSRKGEEKRKAGIDIRAEDSGGSRSKEPCGPGTAGRERTEEGPQEGPGWGARRMRGEDGHVAPSTGRERQVQWEEGASRTSTCPRTSRRRGGRRANGRPSRAGAGPGGLGWAALRQLAEPCGRRGREGGPSRRPRKPACLSLPPAPAPPAWCRLLSKRRRRGVRDAPRRRPGLEASRLPHFLLQCPCAAVAAGGMAAARGSGRASAPRLLLLLLFPLLWAPAGVRAVPEEDLSHRNKEPPAPAQQLQPQPAAGQGPEPARAEVSGPRRGGRGCGAGAPGTRLAGALSAALGPELRAGEGSPAPLPGVEDGGVRFFPVRPGLARSLWGRGRESRREPAGSLQFGRTGMR